MRLKQLLFLIFFYLTICPLAFGQEQDWVRMWALNGRTEQEVAKRLKLEYQTTLTQMKRVFDLEEPQEKKLVTAAEGDIKRFLRDVARIRDELKEKKLNVNNNNNNNVQEAWNIVQPLSTRIQKGLFKENSLFKKVTKSTLNKEQRESYDAEVEKSRKRRWNVLTRVNVSQIEKSMPLLEEQREKLLALLDAVEIKTKGKRQWQPHMNGYVGFLRLMKIEDEELEKFLDKEQMAVIEEYRNRYRGWGNWLE